MDICYFCILSLSLFASLPVSSTDLKSKPTQLHAQRNERFDVKRKPSLTVELKLKKRQDISPWSQFTCCRSVVNIQTRERLLDNRYLQMEAQDCESNFCKDCYERLDICEGLRDYQHACASLRLKGFMSRHCPATCGWCGEDRFDPPDEDLNFQTASKTLLNETRSDAENEHSHHLAATTKPLPDSFKSDDDRKLAITTLEHTTATRPAKPTTFVSITTNATVVTPTQTVRVYFSGLSSGKYTYKFTTSTESQQWPWNKVALSKNLGEVDAFNLYKEPNGEFTQPIHFCKARLKGSRHNWVVSSHPCHKDPWEPDMILYGSLDHQKNSELLSVANRGWFPWNSRIYKGKPCCDYVYGIWSFFAPLMPSTTTPTTPTSTTTATTPPATTPLVVMELEKTQKLLKKEIPTNFEFSEENGDLISTFDRACLFYHNYYRFAHGVPVLALNEDLIETAQKWANFLANNAPKHPFKTIPGFKRTPNWPHSEVGTEYRKYDIGENIAWDFSANPSPANESVLRWYIEVFHYNRNNPASDKEELLHPTGHFTQLLWKESVRLGCATATRVVRRGPFEYISTYTVAHYSPAGNKQYDIASKTRTIYDRNVPVRKPGTCLSPSNCSNHAGKSNHCMGFSSTMQCGCATGNASVFGGRPQCVGEGGCVVSCEKPSGSDHRKFYSWANECQGQTSCQCVYSPVNGEAGAVCY